MVTLAHQKVWEKLATDGSIFFTGSAENTREHVSVVLEEKLGFFVGILFDEENYHDLKFYLDPENKNDCSIIEINVLQSLGLTIGDTVEANHEAICRIASMKC